MAEVEAAARVTSSLRVKGKAACLLRQLFIKSANGKRVVAKTGKRENMPT